MDIFDDYATVKYDTAGVEQWVARYNGPVNESDDATAVSVDGSGNVHVAGVSLGLGGDTDYDYATVKYDDTGMEAWVARYDGHGTGDDGAGGLAVDASGNVYVTGYSQGAGDHADYATAKYDAAGAQQWVARYDGPMNDLDGATALAVDASGNAYVTGYSYGLDSRDYATVKYTPDGEEEWVARYDGPDSGDDDASAVAVDEAGNVYVTGSSFGGWESSYDYATVKYDAAGVQQWAARYDGPGNSTDQAFALAVDGSGNVYVTGHSTGAESIDYATVKYNASGDEQWAVRYDGPDGSGDNASALAVDVAGNVYVTGGSASTDDPGDYATLKYNAAGVEQWVARYDGPASDSDWASALALDAGGNVYVTGSSCGSGSSCDYATVKYDDAGVQ